MGVFVVVLIGERVCTEKLASESPRLHNAYNCDGVTKCIGNFFAIGILSTIALCLRTIFKHGSATKNMVKSATTNNRR